MARKQRKWEVARPRLGGYLVTGVNKGPLVVESGVDAHLIAAAPALFKALAELLEVAPASLQADKAQAALDVARGEAS